MSMKDVRYTSFKNHIYYRSVETQRFRLHII